MAEFTLQDPSSISEALRAEVRAFEARHPGFLVLVTDRSGIWEVRVLRGSWEQGAAYLVPPGARGKAARICWPGGLVEVLTLEGGETLEGVLQSALKEEEKRKDCI
jgi:hypothetical protein